ncbi:MAG TPA: phosphoribosyltransferase, partial [Archangium sp.]|nr:phosphoribosyltransferase [Archangium sp.]
NYSRELWPAYKLALALFQARLGAKVAPVLRRVKAVKKSNQSKADERTTVDEHIDSLKATVASLADVPRVLLIDDVLTRGSQMIGAMQVLRHAGYEGEIVGFTSAYTIFPENPRHLNVRAKVLWREGSRYAWHDSVTPRAESQSSSSS